GRTDTATQQVEVVEPIDANFTASAAGLDVQFTNQSSGAITSYQWDFGDGQTSADPNPLHTYAASGAYNVTLTVVSSDGRTDSITQQVNIAAPIAAAFSTTIDGLNVQFVNESTGDLSSYQWDFGDGQTSADPNPLHTYAAGGTY